MGIYVNSDAACTLFENEVKKQYFVDKSQMLEELFPLVREGTNYICITRPRRFGKTVMANMIAAFFSKASDTSGLFGSLEISKSDQYEFFRNRYAVIHISFNDISRQCKNYEQYIARIEGRLVKDLKEEYPGAGEGNEGSAVDLLLDIYAEDHSVRFIFVLDEWDFPFHQSFTEEEKKAYLAFLRSLLKDRPYVLLVYMTGILPIAKYSSGSELNMFAEFSMAGAQAFSNYFGFTQEEVDKLYQRYCKSCINPRVTQEGLKEWYNGYHTASGECVYNPRSVVWALRFNQLANYWTNSGPYDEIYYYIENNVAAVRDDLARMISGISVPVKIREYAATSMKLLTKEEIFSAMVVYGFLSYGNGKVSIPNQELMERFEEMLRKETSLGYVYRLARESDRMLEATLTGDTDTMAQILEFVHDTEVPLLSYNSESDLTAIVNLAYLAARDTYRVEREDKAGAGYVDFIFYPKGNRDADGIILELKVDHSPEEAIQQIKERKYALRFQGKLGEKPEYTGRILAVGIGYDRKQKKHRCKIEVLSWPDACNSGGI